MTIIIVPTGTKSYLPRTKRSAVRGRGTALVSCVPEVRYRYTISCVPSARSFPLYRCPPRTASCTGLLEYRAFSTMIVDLLQQY